MDFPHVTPQRLEFLERATATYSTALKDAPEAVEFLKGRGIDGSTAQRFRLGYVASPLENHDQMQGMLSIPYVTPTGVTAIRFRRISGNGNKYHQESGSFSPLFNVRDLHRSEPYLAICEGELDAVIMSGMVGVPAVAIPGTGQWGKRGRFYSRLLQDYDKVFVVMDPDKAGQDLVPNIMKYVANPVNIVLPLDVNDTFIREGAEFIRRELGLWQGSEELSEMALSA